MTKSTSWQATLNASNQTQSGPVENNLDSVKVNRSLATNATGTTKVFVVPKRYSFDDNGGSYRGL